MSGIILAVRLWLATYCPNGMMAPAPLMPHNPISSRYVCWSVIDNHYLCSTVEAV